MKHTRILNKSKDQENGLLSIRDNYTDCGA